MDDALYKRAIKFEEGFMGEPYHDSVGNVTIGYGFNLEAIKMPRKVADYWLQVEIEKREADLISIFGEFRWASLLPAQRAALISMHYQLGAAGFRQFENMIHCVKQGDMSGASRACMDSKAARTPELKARFKRNAEALQTAKVPKEWSE